MSEAPVIAALRVALHALFLFGTVGTGVELLLLGHTEDIWQLLPLLLMGLSLPAWAWWLARRRRISLRSFQAVMGLFVLSGFTGLVLHFRGNVEFELEMYPSLAGLPLWWEAVRGATPTLAPGTMIELGFLGLATTYRAPLRAEPDIKERSA
ncbi:MAG TPA: hypothetical protein VD793_08105 [Gemmatimonadales bacterium]|nr:hypothetical protein [Gemmatimonadales bacterium]